jgi:L-seryl-tRNA(Ser) seleniumtransferase
MAGQPDADPRRLLPSVDHVLQRAEVRALEASHGRSRVVAEVRGLLEEARRLAMQGDTTGVSALIGDLPGELARRVDAARRPSLVRVINATGVVIHTNLGRAPLPAAAVARVAEVATGYSNLEFDLDRGERGDREAHAESRLRRILGSGASLVVNNNAAAVLLAVNTFAEGREVVASRGELVEIGGSFRIPDVVRKGGARLVEVGTTNRTRLADYQAAVGAATGLILKVHPSNFRILGFTEAPSREALASLARGTGLPFVEDLGSGLLSPLPPPLHEEATAGQALAGGADIVTFSGDKLLGGPQAGLVAGREDLVAAMRRNPLYRALRVDKMTVAALDAVLSEHEAGRAATGVPVLGMLGLEAAAVRERAEALARALASTCPEAEVTVVDDVSAVGGGAAPLVDLPTAVVRVAHPRQSPRSLAARLRDGSPPVVARIADDALLLDLRTVLPPEERELLAAVSGVLAG